MQEQREKWELLGREILTAARNELLVSMRFLELAFPMLLPRMDQNSFFIGTDGIYLHYNARFLAQRYQNDPVMVNRAYFHVLLHGIFRHIFDSPDAWEDREKEELWELSCDIAVEYLIDQVDEPCVRRVIPEGCEELYQKLLEALPVMTAEGIYHFLKHSAWNALEISRLSALFLVDDHQYWQKSREGETAEGQQDPEKDIREQSPDAKSQKEAPGEQKKKPAGGRVNRKSCGSGEKGEEQDGQGPEDKKWEAGRQSWTELSEKLQNSLETYFTAEAGNAKSLLRALRRNNRKKTDYRCFLRKFASVQEELKVDADAFDYAFYEYGLSMYGNIPLMEELEYKETYRIQEFVIVLDTSGSCSGRLIREFLQKTLEILMTGESFGKNSRVWLMQCDAGVQDEVVIGSREEAEAYVRNFEVRGLGGTDFRPAFERVEELRNQGELKKLKGLLYFTDGYGIYPKKRTDYSTAFVFVDNMEDDVEVPAWAMKVTVS